MRAADRVQQEAFCGGSAATCAGGSATVFHAPAAQRFGSGRRALLAGAVVSVAVLLAVVIAGRLLEPVAVATNFADKNLAPSASHLFGTDWMGRDMLARTVSGLGTSIVIGLVSAVVSSALALVVAAVAALGGKRADAAVSWLIDLTMGIPHIVLLILISYALGRGEVGVCVGVACTHWPSLARVLRAEILQLRAQPYLACSRALGVSRARIALAHALPCVLPQYLVGLVLLFPHAILHEASISFLGYGLPPEQPAIGIILSESLRYLSAGMWWPALLPGAALVLLVLLADKLGSCLERLLAPASAQE